MRMKSYNWLIIVLNIMIVFYLLSFVIQIMLLLQLINAFGKEADMALDIRTINQINLFKNGSIISLFYLSAEKIFYLLVFFWVRKIILSVKAEGLFEKNQFLTLRKIGLSFLLIGVFFTIVSAILFFTVDIPGNKYIKYDYLMMVNFVKIYGSFPRLILPGLLIYFLSDMFASGYFIKQENDLTI